MDWKNKLREIIEDYPNFDSFLKSRNEDWVSEVSEVKAKILFLRLRKPANTPMEVTIEEAIGYIGNEEKGASDLRDMILRQEWKGVYEALTQIEVTGQLRKHHGDKVEMEYSESGTDSEPDAMLETDEGSFVIEITDADCVIRADEDSEPGEVKAKFINTTDGNKLGSKVSNKLERQLKHFSNDHYTVLVMCSESIINHNVLESHLLGNPKVKIYTDKETGEPAGSETVRGTPVINLDENSEHLDMLFHYNDTSNEASLYASVGLDWQAVKVIADIFGQKEVTPFKNDENMEYEEWQKEEKE